MKLKNSILGGVISILSFSASAQSVNILVNNKQTIQDSNASTFYTTVQQQDDNSIEATLQVLKENVPYEGNIVLDGVEYVNGGKIRCSANVKAHSIVIDKDTLHLVLTNLPLVKIDYDPNIILEKGVDTKATISIVDVQDWIEDKIFTTPIYISLRGATAAQMEKKSYSIALVDDKGEEFEKKLFDIRKTDKWIMDAAAIDYSRIRNRVTFDIWNEMSTLRDKDMKRNGTQGQFCELILNGQYNGIYCFSDKINRSLLGLKKTKDQENIHGLLYKCDKASFNGHSFTQGDEHLDMTNEEWGDFSMKHPDYYCSETWMPLANTKNKVDALTEDTDSVDALVNNFYKQNFYEYAVFAMSFMLTDNMMHNTYLSFVDYEKDKRLWITPWDLDGGFGRDGSGSKINRTAQSWIVFQNCKPFRYYYDHNVEPFMSNYNDTWEKLSTSVLSVDNVSNIIDKYTHLLDQNGAWQRERERWNGMQNCWHKDEPINLGYTAAEEAQYMKDWYEANFSDMKSKITSIESAKVENTLRNSSIYSIDGRIVNVKSKGELSSGLYIINGKKVVISK